MPSVPDMFPVIDVSAFAGEWPFRPVDGDIRSVRETLRLYGVTTAVISPLGSAWCRNPHALNRWLFDGLEAFEDLWPVPVLDPTIATWPDELDRAARHPHVRMVRLLPTYSPYALIDADPLLRALGEVGLIVVVQTRLEDPRRQHPLARVADLPASEVTALAERHPEINVVLGGPRTAEVHALTDKILALDNLYVDVSQCDGMDALAIMVERGLTDRLLFGSHVPLFSVYSALARVALDLDEDSARKILGGNAQRLLGLNLGSGQERLLLSRTTEKVRSLQPSSP